MEIRGNRVLITGGCGGIGTAIAREFLKLNTKVILCDLNIETGLELAKRHDGVVCLQMDLGDTQEIDRHLKPLIESDDAPDILVNNVGISPKKDTAGKAYNTWEMPLEQWNRVMAVNLTSYFYCSKLVVPAMKEKGGGRIINIASLAVRTGGYVAPVHYVVSKSGVLGLTKVLAKEVAQFGINVNAINPGRIDTPMIHDVPDEVNQSYIERIPAGRLGLPEDVAKVVVFLTSDLSDYITGTAIEVNGGLFMG
ncbi:MAG: SDR family oxidoreductase [Deltaproteobacteria bacterium]|nr:SDR family oxidoreductase [Deltaproteobacteria bacterium]